MSITSSQTTVQLRSMSMDDLHDDLTNLLAEHQISMTLESKYDDELVMTVSKNPLTKTSVKLVRLRHRPLDIVIEADYKKAGGTKDVVRVNKPSSDQNSYSYRWLWIPLLFGGVIITILNTIGDSIAQLLGNNDGLNSLQIVGVTIVFSLLVGFGMVYGVPYLTSKRDRRMKAFDEEILSLFSDRIRALDRQQQDSPTVRCWSCFEEIELNKNTCSNCGEQQQ